MSNQKTTTNLADFKTTGVKIRIPNVEAGERILRAIYEMDAHISWHGTSPPRGFENADSRYLFVRPQSISRQLAEDEHWFDNHPLPEWVYPEDGILFPIGNTTSAAEVLSDRGDTGWRGRRLRKVEQPPTVITSELFGCQGCGHLYQDRITSCDCGCSMPLLEYTAVLIRADDTATLSKFGVGRG